MRKTLDFALVIKADLTEATKEVARLDQSLDRLGASGQASAQGLNAASAAANKASSALKAEGAAASAAAAAHTRLAPALTTSSAALHRGALTAGQYNMAMRQLPMQITDIVTGLASGQSVFMVGIQQGGQLRDAFGGIVPAARALVGALNPVVLAVGAGAATIGLIGKALVDGYQEMRGFERALISTGNVAGVTASEVANLADRVGDATGAYGDAAAAALVLVESGKLSRESLEAATSAAVNLAKLTGDAVSTTAEEIAKLAAAPSAQLLKLNERYHFLTVEVYNHIRALEQQGAQQEAAARAVEYFASVHEDRVREAEARAGYLERSWMMLRKTVRGVWDDIKSIGRYDPEADLQAAEARLDLMRRNSRNWTGETIAQQEQAVRKLRAQVENDRAQAERSAKTQSDNDAALAKLKQADEDEKRWEQLRLSNLDKAARLEEEIALIREIGQRRNKSELEIEQQIAAARARYAESLAKPAKAPKTDAERDQEAAERELETLQRKTAMLDLLEASEKRVTEVERIRYEIEQGSYRLASAAVKQQLLDQAALADAAAQERADLEAKERALEKAQRAYDALSDALRTPAEVAVETAIERIGLLNEALDAGVASAEAYRDGVSRAFNAAFEKPPTFAGLSPEIGGVDGEQYRLDQQKAELEQWYAEQLALLEQFRAQKEITQAEWNAREMLLQQQHQDALATLNDAQQTLMLNQLQSAFGSMADIARAFGGEQSRTYKALFAISKGFAVAESAVALAQNVANASKVGFPQNLPLIAGALAQGAQIASLLASAKYAAGGRIEGPGTGTSDSVPILASAGEFMVRERSAREPGAYQFLAAFNAQGMRALDSWRGYAEGGLIAPAEPRSDFASREAAAASAPRRTSSSLVVGLSEGLVLQELDTAEGVQVMQKHVSRNRQAFRAALGL